MRSSVDDGSVDGLSELVELAVEALENAKKGQSQSGHSRIVYRRPHRIATDGCAWQFPLRAGGRCQLQQRGEDGPARRARGHDRGTRGRQ